VIFLVKFLLSFWLNKRPDSFGVHAVVKAMACFWIGKQSMFLFCATPLNWWGVG
jgi:hypothetical protein